MDYSERIKELKLRYSDYNIPEPERELVENDQFRCPYCGQVYAISNGRFRAQVETSSVPFLLRGWARRFGGWHGEQVLYKVCSSCLSKTAPGKPISMSTLALGNALE